jgi:hypothetical protein
MGNTISYKDLKQYYLNDTAKELARKVFGDNQPAIYQTGFYAARSWNWAYRIGLVQVDGQIYDVVTQFGRVVGARHADIPVMRESE